MTIPTFVTNFSLHCTVCYQVCKNRSYLHIQFHEYITQPVCMLQVITYVSMLKLTRFCLTWQMLAFSFPFHRCLHQWCFHCTVMRNMCNDYYIRSLFHTAYYVCMSHSPCSVKVYLNHDATGNVHWKKSLCLFSFK